MSVDPIYDLTVPACGTSLATSFVSVPSNVLDVAKQCLQKAMLLRITFEDFVPSGGEEIKRDERSGQHTHRHPTYPRTSTRGRDLRIGCEEYDPAGFPPEGGNTSLAPARIVETRELDRRSCD